MSHEKDASPAGLAYHYTQCMLVAAQAMTTISGQSKAAHRAREAIATVIESHAGAVALNVAKAAAVGAQ